MELVKVKNNEIYCDSSDVAKKFGMKHNKVARTIENILPNLEDFRGTACTPSIEKTTRNYRGRDYTAYLINKDAFTLVMMRFDTKRARKWQGRYIGAFNSMETMLKDSVENKKDERWLLGRAQGKQIRLDTTDVIKDFVDYATAQGSQSAKFYYKHITNLTYKALNLLACRKPKLRDTLNIYELSQVSTAEQLVQRSLKKHMKDNLPYKAVYKYVIADLERFSESLFLGEKA